MFLSDLLFILFLVTGNALNHSRYNLIQPCGVIGSDNRLAGLRFDILSCVAGDFSASLRNFSVLIQAIGILRFCQLGGSRFGEHI